MKGRELEIGGLGANMGIMLWLPALFAAIPAGIAAFVIFLFLGGYSQLAMYVLASLAVLVLVMFIVKRTMSKKLEKQMAQSASVKEDLMRNMPKMVEDMMNQMLGGTYTEEEHQTDEKDPRDDYR